MHGILIVGAAVIGIGYVLFFLLAFLFQGMNWLWERQWLFLIRNIINILQKESMIKQSLVRLTV